jgi:F5/8 type C domain/Right handed beta helix region
MVGFAVKERDNVMSQVMKLMAVASWVVLLFTSTSYSSEYQGFGAETPGGSGQPVYRVTNLRDSGPGSLRDAVSRSRRYIVFDVAGEINLSSRIHVRGSYITIDGFTAPEPGITLKGWGLYMWGKDGAHNIIVRGIRVRNSGGDGLHVSKGAHDIVIDRSSVAFAGDGNIDITEGAYNVTVSRTILAEPASGNKNMLIMYDNPRRITLHHNLFVKAESRSPQVQTDGFGTPATETTVDMRNNVIWDWTGGYGTRLRYGPRVNVINNFYAANGGDARDALIVCPGPECDDSNPASAARVYAEGNISADGINLDARGNQSAPFPAAQVDTQDAFAAACLVVSSAGVRPLDAVDQQYLSEISLPPCEVTSLSDPPAPNANPNNACRSSNLAVCAMASASSVWSSSYDARKSNDSSSASRWNSANGETAGAWLALEFGSPITFDRVVLNEAFNRITGYILQYWDGAGWRDIASGSSIGASKIHLFTPLTSQRVRLLVTRTISSSSVGTPTIYEFEVYGNRL